MGHILSLCGQSGPWAAWEHAILGEMQRAFEQEGLMTNCEHGVSDAGTPWTAFYEQDCGEFVAHIARHKRGYVLLWPDQTSVHVTEMAKLVQVVRSSAKVQTWH